MVHIRGSPSTSPYHLWFSCQRSTKRLDMLSTAQTSSQRSGWSNRNNAHSLMSQLILRWTIVVRGLRKWAGRWRIFCKISILLYMIYLTLHRFWSLPRFSVVDVRKCLTWCLVKATATGCTLYSHYSTLQSTTPSPFTLPIVNAIPCAPLSVTRDGSSCVLSHSHFCAFHSRDQGG